MTPKATPADLCVDGETNDARLRRSISSPSSWPSPIREKGPTSDTPF